MTPWIALKTVSIQFRHYFQINIHIFNTKIEPQHEIANNVLCATSKGSDQSVHMRNLIKAFAGPLNIL